LKGKIKNFFTTKGYGFIEGEDGQDYFFHFTSCPKGIVWKQGDEVNFEPTKNERGLAAVNIKPADSGEF